MKTDPRHYDSKRKYMAANMGRAATTAKLALIGELDDRRKKYLAVRDGNKLLELAAEYDALKMLTTAKAIRLEASYLRRSEP